eukprot:SAG22_NODE_2969_length_2061_cov_1.966871_3_plen_430_part_00
MPSIAAAPDTDAEHARRYHEEGYTVFRSIIPPPLLERLRVACGTARTLARGAGNPQAQRLQPVLQDGLDQAPFIAYEELAPLRAAVGRLLDQPARFGDRSVFGVLIEPRDRPWSTNWHRDWRDNIPGIDTDMWWQNLHDPACFNQINCALYDDHCLWVVPGSHRRGDTAEEVARFPARPVPAPVLHDSQSDAERTAACIDYANSMPGAVNLRLQAGDFCIYKNTLWHMGVYSPEQTRATLHDAHMSDEFRQLQSALLASRPPPPPADSGKPGPRDAAWAGFEHKYVGSSPPRTNRRLAATARHVIASGSSGRGSAGAGGGVGVDGGGGGGLSQPRKTYQVAIVGGAGMWGRWYMHSFASHPDVEICALVDRSGSRAEEYASHFACPLFEDVEALLATGVRKPGGNHMMSTEIIWFHPSSSNLGGSNPPI